MLPTAKTNSSSLSPDFNSIRVSPVTKSLEKATALYTYVKGALMINFYQHLRSFGPQSSVFVILPCQNRSNADLVIARPVDYIRSFD